MRKVIASLNITLDGFISGPENDLNWHFPMWNNDMSTHAKLQLVTASTIILGRVTYETMAAYWPTAPASEFSTMMNNYEKVVFSNSLKRTMWKNARVADGNIQLAVSKLKQESGDNIIIYGSGSLMQDFIRYGLIDEFRLWVHPIIIGKGVPLFQDPAYRTRLNLLRTKVFSSGVIILYYKPLLQ